MRASSTPQVGSDAQQRISFAALMSSMAVVVLLSGVVQGYLTPLLPTLGHELHISASGQSNIYLLFRLSAAVWMPLLAKLGDAYGYRRFLRVAIALVAAGSVLMAVWPTMLTLSIGVVLQGAIIGFVPLLIGILRYQAPHRRRFGIGLLTGTLLASLGLGGLVAGALSEYSATLGLWVAVPVAVLAVIVGLVLPDGGPGSGERLAFLPYTLLTLGLLGIVGTLALGGTWGWLSLRTVGLFLAGVVMITAWVVVELKVATPLVDLRVLATPQVAVVNGVTFCLGFCTIGFLGANAIFLGSTPGKTGIGLGYGPQAIALVSLARAFLSVGSSLSVATLMRKIGERGTLALSGAAVAASFVSFLLWHDTVAEYLIATGILGLGMGGYEASTLALIAESVPAKDTAIATGINELSRSLGVTIGAAVISAIIATHQTEAGATVSGFNWVWAVCAAAAFIAAGLGTCYRQRKEFA